MDYSHLRRLHGSVEGAVDIFQNVEPVLGSKSIKLIV